ncbi:MAG: Holliday junction branch migration protein RuvA [Deltaproteobacteria bacterium]|nr:Holliday junction branch migration protein RuvA [Deltaproteobacteria bacterium]
MIARLEGTLVREGDRVIVDCNGVGYEVTCSAYTVAALPSHGEKVTLRVYTQMRETAIALFGFWDAHERDLFDLLITVKNVGPSTAIAMLSGAGPRDIAALIAREDVPGLTKIKGIGKKTAELLVVELREKCELLVLSWNAGGIRPGAAPSGTIRTAKTGRHPLLGEVMTALINMGWRPNEAEGVVAELAVDESSTIEVLLRQALRSMPR